MYVYVWLIFVLLLDNRGTKTDVPMIFHDMDEFAVINGPNQSGHFQRKKDLFSKITRYLLRQ